MKFVKVKLKDYGLYKGEAEFDFTPRKNATDKRKVILFGGKNGAGKTTLLEAVKLGLYGKACLGKISIREYSQYLKSKIHKSRGQLLNPEYAAIELTFDHASAGVQSRYKITRSWSDNNGESTDERLRLEKDGELIKDIEPEYQQEFISSIVPENLAQLFFFDGEKIQSIADDITSNAAIAESVQMLLGLDVVHKLQADLSIFTEREAKKSASKEELQSLTKCEEQLKKIESDKEDLDVNRGELVNELDRKEKDEGKLKTELAVSGASFADSLEEQRKIEFDQESERIILEKQIRQEAESDFAVSLCPSIAKKLKKIIHNESKQVYAHNVLNEVKDLNNELISKIKKSKKLKEQKEVALKIISKTFDSRCAAYNKSISDNNQILDNAESDNRSILTTLESSEINNHKISELCKQLDKTNRSIRDIKEKQKRAPDEEFLKPLFSKLANVNQEIGQLKEKINAIDFQKEALERQFLIIDRARNRIINENKKADSKRKQIKVAAKAQEALAEYSQLLIEQKIKKLSGLIVECFNSLIRKGSFISDVTINPMTFEVTLFDKNENLIKKEELSSGEKQLFAISVLWALAKSSGRELPVIIDTPLGRLDSDHRLNLVKNYFPHAAHQVVILSTDTEVDTDLYNTLKPAISHCYHLEYNKKESRTIIQKGYFWDK